MAGLEGGKLCPQVVQNKQAGGLNDRVTVAGQGLEMGSNFCVREANGARGGIGFGLLQNREDLPREALCPFGGGGGEDIRQNPWRKSRKGVGNGECRGGMVMAGGFD